MKPFFWPVIIAFFTGFRRSASALSGRAEPAITVVNPYDVGLLHGNWKSDAWLRYWSHQLAKSFVCQSISFTDSNTPAPTKIIRGLISGRE
ncbi:MAG TPA: hypothetical protein VGB45_04260 [Abditibacterium sp.]|jgi:hypothetical protein